MLQASASRLGALAATLQLPQPDPSSGAPTAMIAGVTRRSTMEAAAPLFVHHSEQPLRTVGWFPSNSDMVATSVALLLK